MPAVVTSPSIADSHTFGRDVACNLASRGRIGFTDVRARAFAVQGATPFAFRHQVELTEFQVELTEFDTCRPVLLAASGYPRMVDRSFILNEQLVWPTPFSQRDEPGLTWRTKAA